MNRIALFAVLMACLSIAAALPAAALDIRTRIEILPLGDTVVQTDFRASPEEYAGLRRSMPTPEIFIKRIIEPEKMSGEARDVTARYDDEFATVRVSMTILGEAKNHDRYWTLKIVKGGQKVRPVAVGDREATFESIGRDGEETMRNDITVTLPPGATETSFDAAKRELRYRLPVPAYGDGAAEVEYGVRVRREIMSAIYKQYGSKDFPHLWVSRVLFTNSGDVPLRDFRVRFSLGDYSDGWGETSETALFLPGQHVVEAYHPILNQQCSRLRSTTPAKLRIEYSYLLPGGKRSEHELVRRINLLGCPEFVFTSLPEEEVRTFAEAHDNAEFLTAWVTSEDPVVAQFGALANELAEGAGAHTSNEAAVSVAAAIYELMRANRITYQSPAGLFNSHSTQHLKFPRDTLRDRSGTCIDLSIAFAAFAMAQGLDPAIILVPGHAFPGIYLPENGNLLALEATVLGGGSEKNSLPFSAAVEIGREKLVTSLKEGRIVIVRPSEVRRQGVFPPELEGMPADILNRWGIVGVAASATVPTPAGPAGAAPPAQGSDSPAARGVPGFVTWSHPEGYYRISVPEGMELFQNKLGSFFLSPEKDLSVGLYTLPAEVDGQAVDEESMVGVFVQTTGIAVTDSSEVSDPQDVSKDLGYRAVGRTLALHDGGGLRMRAVTAYVDAPPMRHLIVITVTGDLLEQGEDGAVLESVMKVVQSISFANPVR